MTLPKKNVMGFLMTLPKNVMGFLMTLPKKMSWDF